MIKPVSLWNFIHECDVEDAEYIGRICLALAGKEIELTRTETIQFRMIRKDNNDMNERICENKAKQRERQKKYRDKLKKVRTDAEDALSRDVTVTERDTPLDTEVTTHPSVRPSIHPSVRPEERESMLARSENGEGETGGRPKTVPTDDEMRQMARQIDIPETYVESFVADMTGLGWGYVNSGGAFVQLNRRNCKAVMRNFYNQHVRGAKKKSGTEHGTTARGTEYTEGLADGLGI